MADLDYQTLHDPERDALEPIDHGLHRYNVSHLGEEVIGNYHRVAVVTYDSMGDIVGGIYGELVWEWLHIDTLWVTETARGQGIGSELLRRLESEAVAKGFHHAHLETTDFQALGFYLRHGYEVFGELAGKPSGVTWHYLKKDLR